MSRDSQALNKFVVLSALVLVILLAAPAIPYIATFGVSLSSDHHEWGEFGDYYGAVLSVLLGACTVLLLLAQLYVTRKAALDDATTAATHLQHARSATDAAHDAVFALESLSIERAALSPFNEDALRLTLSNYGSIVLNVAVEPVTGGIRAGFAHTDWLPVLKREFPIHVYVAPPPTTPVQFQIFVQRRDGKPRRHLMLLEPLEGRLSTMMVDDVEVNGETGP